MVLVLVLLVSSLVGISAFSGSKGLSSLNGVASSSFGVVRMGERGHRLGVYGGREGVSRSIGVSRLLSMKSDSASQPLNLGDINMPNMPDLHIPEQVESLRNEVDRAGKKMRKWSSQNWLILGEVAVIIAAWLNPALGATGGPLRPEVTISKLAIFIIFFINGIALELAGDPEQAAKSAKSNLFIQLFNFGAIPIIVKFLAPFYPNKEFVDGLLLLGCLPCTINISVAQTLSAGCDMGTAIFNAIFGNVVGVFLTPLLSIAMLGASSSVSLLGTLKKLGGIVILPLVLGQLARFTKLRVFAEKYNRQSRNFSSCLLLAIVYNIFSDTFQRGLGIKKEMLANLLTIMPLSYLTFSYLFWETSKKALPGLDIKTRGAGLLSAPSKTMAFGIPFIKTAVGHRPDIAYLLAPLLLYAPAQLLLGSSVVVPFLQGKIDRSQQYEAGAGI